MSGRFLITTWTGGGNVPPAIALGLRLQRRGHKVRLMGWRDEERLAAAAGFDWATYPSVAEWPAGVALEDDLDGLEARLDGPGAAQDIVEELREHPADVLVADCMSGAAVAAGDAAGVPMAILVHLMYSMYTGSKSRQQRFAGTRAALGLDPMPDMPFAEQLAALGRMLCIMPAGLDMATTSVPADTFFVGPVLAPDLPTELWPKRSDAPLVLLSFSTTLMQQRAGLPPVLDALAALPIEGVLTLGGALPASVIQAPANFTVREFVPHEAILPCTSVVVSHGGLSTITMSLAYGVPLVCIPQGRDQTLNAERVASAGVGIHVPRDAPASEMADAVTRVLDDGRYRAAAREMAACIDGLGRGEEAARLTEELLPGPA